MTDLFRSHRVPDDKTIDHTSQRRHERGQKECEHSEKEDVADKFGRTISFYIHVNRDSLDRQIA